MQVSKKTADPAEAVLREIEEMGKRSFIPSIGPVKGRIIAEVVAKLKPRKILEVGSMGIRLSSLLRTARLKQKSQLSRRTRNTPA
jgi:predicted O-methyltransferase YrrM